MIARWLPRFALASLAATTLLAGSASATEIWTGRTFGFSKAPFANINLAANQDRITPAVWLTRANTMGLFNIKQEAAYVHNVSPLDTEWATGNAVDYASLTFQPWELWNEANPPAYLNVDAVMHLISEDIYVDIRFTAWGGGTSGGSFSYLRALPPVVPTQPTSWGRIKQLYR